MPTRGRDTGRATRRASSGKPSQSKRSVPLKYRDRMFVHLLNRAAHEVSADFVRVLRARGFTVRQWRVLSSLWDEESLTLTALTEETFCGKATLTHLIERLRDQGLVTRRPDSIDRRKTHISLTPAVREQISDLMIMSEAREKKIIDSIGSDRVQKMMIELRDMIAMRREIKKRIRRKPGQ